MCALQGTAFTEQAELLETYGLQVLRVPPHRPSVRKDHPMRVFTFKEVGFSRCVVWKSRMNGWMVDSGSPGPEDRALQVFGWRPLIRESAPPDW